MMMTMMMMSLSLYCSCCCRCCCRCCCCCSCLFIFLAVVVMEVVGGGCGGGGDGGGACGGCCRICCGQFWRRVGDVLVFIATAVSYEIYEQKCHITATVVAVYISVLADVHLGATNLVLATVRASVFKLLLLMVLVSVFSIDIGVVVAAVAWSALSAFLRLRQLLLLPLRFPLVRTHVRHGSCSCSCLRNWCFRLSLLQLGTFCHPFAPPAITISVLLQSFR